MLRTVVETPTFRSQASTIWSNTEYTQFINWIAAHPNSGTVIPGSEGTRKIRWAQAGRGKRGGARVIYYHVPNHQIVLLIAVYAKVQHTKLPLLQIKRLRSRH